MSELDSEPETYEQKRIKDLELKVFLLKEDREKNFFPKSLWASLGTVMVAPFILFETHDAKLVALVPLGIIMLTLFFHTLTPIDKNEDLERHGLESKHYP